MMSFLLISVVASIALTIAVNIAVRVVGQRSRRPTARRHDPGQGSSMSWPGQQTHATTRVIFPWKLMLGVSITATILINLIH